MYVCMYRQLYRYRSLHAGELVDDDVVGGEISSYTNHKSAVSHTSHTSTEPDLVSPAVKRFRLQTPAGPARPLCGAKTVQRDREIDS